MPLTKRPMAVFVLGLLLGAGGFLAVQQPPGALAQALSEAEKAQLRAEYDQLQAEIAEWQKVLDETTAKKNTIQGDVTYLNAQIKKAETEIRQRNNTISSLAGDINEKTKHISVLEQRLAAGRESLAQLIREKNEVETMPLAVMLLGSSGLSEFFAVVDTIDTLNQDLQDHFNELRGTKVETEKEKAQLSVKKDQELDARYEVEVKKEQIKEDEAEKQRLLNLTAAEESGYQQVLAERQRRADEIRTALFDLRDTQGISFELALQYAQAAQTKTGVRAALTLAILSQESDLGNNIGSCLMSNLQTGDGVGKNTGRPFEKVMKAPRDTEPFAELSRILGFPWATTPVSCPLGQTYTSGRGYGGAMGPSQFIPSTWMLFADRIGAAVGVSNPNPWNPQHSVMATAIYLSDLGADSGGYSAERNAACRYYSGRRCDTARPTNYTYGNSVVAKAEEFQKNIDFLASL